MLQKKITVQKADGLDADMIAVLVQRACKFESRIYLESDDKKVNAKSIMGMMTLGLDAGEEVCVVAEGDDENEAVAEIEKYLSDEIRS